MYLEKNDKKGVPDEKGRLIDALENTTQGRFHIPLSGTFPISDGRDHVNALRANHLIVNCSDAFCRSRYEGHITASAFVIDRSAKHVLLTHHAKLDCWLQLGGHCDGIQDPFAVALTEAREETGIEDIRPKCRDIFDIDIHRIPAYGVIKAHLHFDIRYLFEADDDAPFTVTRESKALAWVPLAELHRYTQKPSVLVINRKLGNQ